MKIKSKIVKLSEIKPNPDNPRKITGLAIDRLVKSLREFPEMMSIREIVVDEDMMVLGGNMRLAALIKSKEVACAVKIVSGLTPEQKREFVVKDNGQWGDWDFGALAIDWVNLPLEDWGVDLPDDWATGPPPEVMDSDGGMSGSNYGDVRSDKIPVNILGVGGMVERDVMERTRSKLIGRGADLEGDNGLLLQEIFTTWLI